MPKHRQPGREWRLGDVLMLILIGLLYLFLLGLFWHGRVFMSACLQVDIRRPYRADGSLNIIACVARVISAPQRQVPARSCEASTPSGQC